MSSACRRSQPAPRLSQVFPNMGIDGNLFLTISSGTSLSISAVEPMAELMLSQHRGEQQWRAEAAASCLVLLRQDYLKHVNGNYL